MDARTSFLDSSASGGGRSSITKFMLLRDVKQGRINGELSLLDASIMIGRFVHQNDKRKSDNSPYFESHNMRMMNAPELYPELGIEYLSEYQKSLIALHDVLEKYLEKPELDEITLDEIIDATQEAGFAKSLPLLTKYPGQPYLNYYMPLCAFGNENELVVKIIDNHNNNLSNPSAERKILYSITIPYGLARLRDDIEEGYDPELFAAQKGLYDGAVLLKHGAYTRISTKKPSVDYQPK